MIIVAIIVFVSVIRLNSKWDLRRLCKTVQAVALPRMVKMFGSHLVVKP